MQVKHFAVAALVTAAFPNGSTAQDNAACGQFDWSIKREQSLFASDAVLHAQSGDTMPSLPRQAIALELKPHATLSYALPPGRPPKTADSFGGFIMISRVETQGLYQVTISAEGWIDAIQDGKALAAVAHTGRRDCADVRKSVAFELRSGPLIIQISGATATPVKLAMLPAE